MDARTSQLSNSTAAKEPNASSISTTLQESKEHLSALKSHIAFAHQCLSLLQNQLNHAADTLSILQDQVVKAQETMEQVIVPAVVHQPPQAQGYNANMVSHYHHPQCGLESMGSPVAGQAAALVQNGKGQKLCSGGAHAVTESGVVHPACRADYIQLRQGTHPAVVPCQCTVCNETQSDAIQQHVDTPSHCKAHESVVTSRGSQDQLSEEVSMPSYSTPVSSSCSGTRPGGQLPQGELSVKTEPNASPGRETVEQNVSQDCGSCTTNSAGAPKVESSSPMAHQLLQVIDVLQSASDGKDDTLTGASTPQSIPQGGGPSVSHFESFSASMDSRLLHTMSPGSNPHSRQRASPRRNRKQGALLLKHQASSGVSGNPVTTAVTTEFHSADLMRVPQPILASTLPPEFLVVPATNYDQDSPSPKAIPAAYQPKESGSSSSEDGAVAITPFMTATTETTTVGSSSDGSLCSVTEVEQNRGEAAVVTCLTQSTGKMSADSSCSGHNIVHINRCTRDASNVSAQPSSVHTSSSDVARPHLSSGGLLNSPHNGLQFVASSVRQTSCIEMATASSPVTYSQLSEAEPTMGQHTTLERQALQVTSAKTRAGSMGTKKPIILSRRSSREQSLPEGVVVLVPTIEDAKRLIASTGGNSSGNTPVLIPQQMLNDIHSDKSRLHEGGAITLPAKRHFDSVSSLTASDAPPTKRLASLTESL